MSPDPTRPDAGQQHGPESVALPEPVAWAEQHDVMTDVWTTIRNGMDVHGKDAEEIAADVLALVPDLHTRAQVEQVRAEAWEAGRRAERAEVVAWLAALGVERERYEMPGFVALYSACHDIETGRHRA